MGHSLWNYKYLYKLFIYMSNVEYGAYIQVYKYYTARLVPCAKPK